MHKQLLLSSSQWLSDSYLFSKHKNYWSNCGDTLWQTNYFINIWHLTLDMRTFEYLNIWIFEHMTIWTFEHLNIWSFTFEHLKIWISEHLNIWTFEQLNIWTSEHLNNWTFEHLNQSVTFVKILPQTII